MRRIKSSWLELLFGIIILLVVYVSLDNSMLRRIDLTQRNLNRLPQSNIEMEVQPLEDYLYEIGKLQNCTAIFTVKDIQGFSLTSEIIAAFKKLGFDQADILLEWEYHAFIGIYSDGKIMYQKIGGDEQLVYKNDINGHKVLVKSGTLNNGNVGIVYIDNIGYTTNTRGINIVLLDNVSDTLIDAITFDTHDDVIPVKRLVNGEIVDVSEGTVIRNAQ